MATNRSIAIRQATALADLQEACAELGQVAGVKAPDLALVTHRDPGIETALRLETLAGFVRAAVTAGPVTGLRQAQPPVDAAGEDEPSSPPAPSPKGRGGSRSTK